MNTILLWPFWVYLLGVLVIVGGMLGLSYVFGEHHHNRTTGEPFESGIKPTGSTAGRIDVKFYLNAVFFVIFDLETMFIVIWAVTLRENGWPGYVEMLIFIGVLMVGLVYLWRLGALDWRLRRRRPPSPPRR